MTATARERRKKSIVNYIARGIRNNNPGNIRHDGVKWKGETAGTDNAFKTFQSMAWGVRAVFHLLNNYNTLYGCNTIEKMIRRWAPENENDTESYISSVSSRTGIHRANILITVKPDQMKPVVAAMIRVENGRDIPREDIDRGWELFEANRK